MTTPNIKIIRLQSGEDIIANYLTDEESDIVMLDKPMHVIFKRLPTGKSVMLMMPWLPLEIIKENTALINECDILTIIEPREELITYYSELSKQSELLLEDAYTGESLMSELSEYEEFYEENEIEAEELESILEDRKKSKLH